jgi:hypothetical protein
VQRIIEKFQKEFGRDGASLKSSDITRLIYNNDVGRLKQAILEYLNRNEDIWILFDNIDKGWPARGTTTEDITILRGLLDASRKVQRTFASRGQDAHTIVFIRQDVHDLLVDQTPDRGKEAAVNLDWSDSELIKSLVAGRIRTSTGLTGGFDSVWVQVCDAHVGGADSFRYVLDRTFLRPRDVLGFIRLAVQIAVSREHSRVEESDFQAAEVTFSKNMLNDLVHEIRDVFPHYPNVLTGFANSQRTLAEDELRITIELADVHEKVVPDVIDSLLWFSFLGLHTEDGEIYSYQLAYDLGQMKNVSRGKQRVYVIHPAFHAALNIRN